MSADADEHARSVTALVAMIAAGRAREDELAMQLALTLSRIHECLSHGRWLTDGEQLQAARDILRSCSAESAELGRRHSEPEACVGLDMDCGRPMPCPDHPSPETVVQRGVSIRPARDS